MKEFERESRHNHNANVGTGTSTNTDANGYDDNDDNNHDVHRAYDDDDNDTDRIGSADNWFIPAVVVPQHQQQTSDDQGLIATSIYNNSGESISDNDLLFLQLPPNRSSYSDNNEDDQINSYSPNTNNTKYSHYYTTGSNPIDTSRTTSIHSNKKPGRRRRRRSHYRHHHSGNRRSKSNMSGEGIRLRADSDGSTKNAFYQGTIVSGPVQEVATGRRTSSIRLLPPRGDPRHKSQQQQQHQPRRKRNNTNNNNSSSSSFSPAMRVHGPASTNNDHIDHLSSTTNGGGGGLDEDSEAFAGNGQQCISDNNSAFPSYLTPLSYQRGGVGRRISGGRQNLRHTSTGSRNTDNSSMNSDLFMGNSRGGVAAAAGGGEIMGDDLLFDFSEIGEGFEVRNGRDSLRYSLRSGISDVSQMLVGTNLLNDDGLTFRGVNTREQELSAESDPAAIGVGTNTKPEDEDSLGLGGDRRSSVYSTSSGVYFNQPIPPGPIIPGDLRTSLLSTYQYPTQQVNPTSSYGSLASLKKARRTTSRGRQSPAPTIEEDDEESTNTAEESVRLNWTEKIRGYLDLTPWLTSDLTSDNGVPYFDESSRVTFARIVRWLFYNPLHPEFTSLHQFCWAVLIGAFMGVFTAGWKLLTEICVEFTWQVAPKKLLEWGVFTSGDGYFPLYHYMWIVPSFLGLVLSLVTVLLPTPIPTQNEWIHALHYRGIQEADSFIPTFVLATLGMTSGLSLGPELPLVLCAGMIGSWVGECCNQSMLSARVMNLTAASAAIGGFFGFPMAGALFVLELPHEMGLQYFEALSPATIASIVAVLVNRIVVNNDVTGMFKYPFLNESLPSYIFKDAVVYGVFGGGLGIVYVRGVKFFKSFVHHLLDWCPVKEKEATKDLHEATPLVRQTQARGRPMKIQEKHGVSLKLSGRLLPNKFARVAMTGALAGAAVGITGIFLPHVMFWGEAQLQTMIDKGRTPLPIFGQDDDPTAAMVSLGYCMVNGSGFSLGCSFSIVIAKIFVTGVSLATGIVGGHFWAPLLVGSAAAHFFTDLMQYFSSWLGYSFSLSAYPCVALLCIMGATHVVTFRAHMAIILILTLSIDAFVPEDGVFSDIKIAGDYAAVFPLLTVAVFVSLHLSREVVFYERKRCRGDIMVVPQALCQPGKEGRPLVMDYEGKLHELRESDYEYETDSDFEASTTSSSGDGLDIAAVLSQEDIEANFLSTQMRNNPDKRSDKSILRVDPSQETSRLSVSSPEQNQSDVEPLPPPPPPVKSPVGGEDSRKRSNPRKNNLKSLDELLNGPIPSPSTRNKKASSTPNNADKKKKKAHRRTQSEPFPLDEMQKQTGSSTNPLTSSSSTSTASAVANRGRLMSASSSSSGTNNNNNNGGGSKGHRRTPSFKLVESYGEIDQEQPSLMDQARQRAASAARLEWHMT